MKARKIDIIPEIDAGAPISYPRGLASADRPPARPISEPTGLTWNRTYAQRASLVLGAAMVLLGIVGIAAPDLWGMHLNGIHNIVHLVLGATAIWLALDQGAGPARALSYVYGALFTLLGATGFVLGAPAISSTPYNIADQFLLPIVPGLLEVGKSDHIANLVIGIIFLLAAVASAPVLAPKKNRKSKRAH